MTFSLYDAVIPQQLQIIGAVSRLLDTAIAFCAESGLSESEIIAAKLADDMLPFSYQVKSVAEHSLGALEAVRSGSYSPSLAPPPDSFDALRDKLAEAAAALEAVTCDELDGAIGKDVIFSFGEMSIPFTAENFLLSFAQPNFYFHAATAYDILRHRGVKIGKRDFLGALRMRTPA